MKTIVNKTHRPLKIKLSQGRVLHLGPAKEGQIATQDADRKSVQQLIESGDVEVYDDASRTGPRAGQGPASASLSDGPHRQFSGSKRGDR